ncbi:MAG TPA: class I lanthipeptide [Thermoanaerobaculia bacterium]|nr:class I lanthipeptide [Thermoanaerobaculia bacterium]
MKKTEKRKLSKLTLSKETIASLEVGKLAEAVGGLVQGPAFSDRWAETTCL